MMVFATRQIDQELMIGREIFISPTDIDARGARILARGRMLGGPDDGGTFESVHELTVGQSFFIGPHVNIALVGVNSAGLTATLGVLRPKNLPVMPKEEFEQIKRKHPEDLP